jgi:nuclear pore complex protein Nup98-Nup96
MFGASKPAFGAAATSAPASGGLFGTAGTSSGTSGFGSGSTGGIGFGGTAATQLPLQGTATTPYAPFSEKEPSSTTMSHYQVISFMPAYKNFSLEVSLVHLSFSLLLLIDW